MESVVINGSTYIIDKLLGKGKGGYSYLVRDEEDNCYTLKKIHHEKCDYYTFPEDKIGLELTHYECLKRIGIKMPQLIDFDRQNDLILKEYINGPTLFELILKDEITEQMINFLRNLQNTCKNNNINIDYFPTNFIVQNSYIFYVDYELNVYNDQWNFDNWGIKYYSKETQEMKEYLKQKGIVI